MIKLAVPDNPVFNMLYEDSINYDKEIQIFSVEETKCPEMLRNSLVDAALLSPLGYSNSMERVDYRIIPSRMLAVEGYSGFASIFFKKGLKTIRNYICPKPEDFLMIIGKILLAERYNLIPSEIIKSGDLVDLLCKAEAVIDWLPSSGVDSALDICEEWEDTFQMPLPLAFWVTRAEEAPDTLISLLNNISKTDLPDSVDIFDYKGVREGKFIQIWNDGIKIALEEVFHVLYYHQYIQDIPEIKIFGNN